MGETASEIENEIENTREDLHSNLEELEGRMRGVTDWRLQFRKRPMLMFGLAFGGGWMLAKITGLA